MRHAARRDANEPELVKIARQLGAWMVEIHEPCDWLMWYRDRWDLVEIKAPSCEGHAHEFTAAQRAFRAEAMRRGARLLVWHTLDELLESVQGRIAA